MIKTFLSRTVTSTENVVQVQSLFMESETPIAIRTTIWKNCDAKTWHYKHKFRKWEMETLMKKTESDEIKKIC